MRRQLVPGLVVRLTFIKVKTWPGIEATLDIDLGIANTSRQIKNRSAKLLYAAKIKNPELILH